MKIMLDRIYCCPYLGVNNLIFPCDPWLLETFVLGGKPEDELFWKITDGIERESEEQ